MVCDLDEECKKIVLLVLSINCIYLRGCLFLDWWVAIESCFRSFWLGFREGEISHSLIFPISSNLCVYIVVLSSGVVEFENLRLCLYSSRAVVPRMTHAALLFQIRLSERPLRDDIVRLLSSFKEIDLSWISNIERHWSLQWVKSIPYDHS